MAEKTRGERIKQARTGAKLSQAALAEAVGVSASDIGKAERGEKELSQAALKAIAKATGVTQKFLLDAAKGGSTAKKTTTTAKKTAAAPAEELTAAEKTMLNAYRKADAETRKAALKLLRGEKDENILSELLQGFLEGNGAGSGLGGGLLDLLGTLGKK